MFDGLDIAKYLLPFIAETIMKYRLSVVLLDDVGGTHKY
jgi:hypothetical protein